MERENITGTVIYLANKIGVSLDVNDISECYRVPTRKGVKPIIVKFVRRSSKYELMKNKKKLKGTGDHGVYIQDDLTAFRSKLLRTVKNDAKVKSCWSVDGRIVCIIVEGGKDVKKYIDSPEDLLPKLGWTEAMLKESGLYFDF